MKTIVLDNYNNKLACDYFGLIAPAPTEGVPSDNIIKTFLIQDRDGNYPDFKAERITMTRFYLSEIPEILSYTSNSVNPCELRSQLMLKYNCDQNQQFAYYLFKKIQ